jgi:hypothetical protein
MAGRTICAPADAAVFPVRSFTKHFRNEFEHLIEHKKPWWTTNGVERCLKSKSTVKN